jgi:predicted kinase
MKKEIWKYFEKYHNHILEQLKKTYHQHSNGRPNPFHLENDCLTHTKMVYEKVKTENVNVLIAAILHDVGKIYTRVEKESGRVSFFGHENVSMVYAIGILNKMEKVFPKIEKKLILEMIAWHGQLWRKKNSDQRTKLINQKFSHDKFYENFLQLVKADAYGRIIEPDNEKHRIDEDFIFLENYIPFNLNKYTNFKPTKEVIMMVGLSGSGKSTYIKNYINNKYKIISLDKYFEKQKLDYDSINYKKQSKKAHIEVLKEINECIKKEDNVVIDMTNLSQEQRRKKLSLFPDTKYKKIGILILKDIEEIKKNLKNRKGKSLSEEVLNKQIENFELPGLDEFHEIKYIF